MFKGIAEQITRARKEVIRQGILSTYLENIKTEQKSDTRNKKKTVTAIAKITFPGFDFNKVPKYPGLKSLFFAVFEKQENETDPSRQKYLNYQLLIQMLEKTQSEFSSIIEPVSQQTESWRTISNLDRLTQRIKQNTQQKYSAQEVSSMLQYIIKSAEIEALAWQLKYTLEIGDTLQKKVSEIFKKLKTEGNWGSWELFQPGKADFMKIQASGIDEVFSLVAQADVLSRAFCFLTSPFLSNRNLESHHTNLKGFKERFIISIIYDWTEGGGPKTAVSKTRQLAGNISAINYAVKELVQKNQNEMELMSTEKELSIKKAEKFVLENPNSQD